MFRSGIQQLELVCGQRFIVPQLAQLGFDAE